MGRGKKVLVHEQIGGQFPVFRSQTVENVSVEGSGTAENMRRVEFVSIFKSRHGAVCRSQLRAQICRNPSVNGLTVKLLAEDGISHSFGRIHVCLLCIRTEYLSVQVYHKAADLSSGEQDLFCGEAPAGRLVVRSAKITTDPSTFRWR